MPGVGSPAWSGDRSTHDVWGKVEAAQLAKPGWGEEEEEELCLWPSGAQLLAGERAESDSSQKCTEKDKGNGHKLQQGKFHLHIKKKKKDCESS